MAGTVDDDGARSGRPRVSERTPLLNQRPADSSAPSQTSARVEKDDDNVNLDASSFRFWALLASYTIVLFLCAVNGTALSPALGAIAESLHAYQHAATWFNASYMIASSCTNPSIGRLATIFNPTYLFLSCTAAFMLGAALTGAAVDSSMFIAGRAILGCGTGGIMTTATVLLVEAAPVKRRGLLVGVINTVITAGSSLGGVISGAFAASRWGWRPAFLLQVPLTAVAAVGIWILSPTVRPRHAGLTFSQKVAKIDYLGILTLSISLVSLLSAAMATSFTLLPIVIGSASLVVFIIVEAYVARLPMVPVQVLVHPPTLFGCLSTLASMTARWTVLFYAPIWGIAVLGYHPASAGATLIPTSFGFSVGGLVVGAAFVRHGGGYYWECIVSLIMLSTTYFAFNQLSQPAAISAYLALLFCNGLAIGSVLNYSLGHILSTTSEKAIVTGLYGSFRGLSPAVGAGVAGGIVQRVLYSSLTSSFISHHHYHHKQPNNGIPAADMELIKRLMGSPNLVWQLKGWQRNAGILAYEEAVRSVFWMALVACAIAIVLQAMTRIHAVTHSNEKATAADDMEDGEEVANESISGEGRANVARV